MILYLLTFAIALTFAFIADTCQRTIDLRLGFSVNSIHDSATMSLSMLRGWRNALIVISAVPLVLLSGLRYDTGIDYFYSYVPSLNVVREGKPSHYDPLFNDIIYIFSHFEDQWFFFFMALYTVSMVYWGICLQTKYIAIPLAIYFVTFNYLRSFCFVAQYVALATFFVGFAFLLKRKWIPAFVLAILAPFLHSSAFIVVPFMLLYFLRNRIILIIAAIIPIFAVGGQNFIRSMIVYLSANTRFDYYVTSDYDSGYADTTMILINLAVLSLFILVYMGAGRRLLHDKKAAIYMLAQSIAFSFSMLQSIIPVGYRFVWFFAFLQCVSIPYMLKKVLDGTLYYMMISAICLCLLVWMIKYPLYGASELLPYHPIFDKTTSYW